MEPSCLEVRNLNASYLGVDLFHGFQLSLETEKWTSILGPSGVGKTTLLRFIAGLSYGDNTQCSGQLLNATGHAWQEPSAYMSQDTPLLEWLNIRENLLLGYRLRGQAVSLELQAQAQDLIEQLGLIADQNKRPSQLSAGMRQRVSLARTLMEGTKLILMDEPFSALDHGTKLKLQNLAQQLLQGKTIVLVTHDPLEALRLSDRLIILGGAPAKITYSYQPQGAAPRDLQTQPCLAEYAQLLAMLSREEL